MKRRTLLISGGASLVILGGLTATRLHSDLHPARRPWAVAGDAFSDPRLRALSYAVLAPSPHNRQPWLISLQDDMGVTLYCDTERLLPETDPFNRQIAIGLGAFIELLRLAAAEDGYRLDITYFPEGEPQPRFDARPVAHIQFSKNTVKRDPLFPSVLSRRTNRSVFEETAISDETVESLGLVIPKNADLSFGYTTATDLISSIKSVCVGGWNIEMATPRTHHESTRLMRVGESEINRSPDGISLSGALMEGLGLAGQLSEDKLNDPTSQAFTGTRDFYTDLINSARSFAWISSANNSRLSQVKSGEAWMRLHLKATELGLAFHPLSQVLQEFPEMSVPYSRIHELLGVSSPGVIQGLFRLGYAKSPPPAPRWPLETRLIEMTS